MNRRTGMIISSAALVAVAVFGSAAGAFAAKTKSATTAGTTQTALAGKAAPTAAPRDGRSGGRGRGPGGGIVDVVAKLTGESTTTVVTARQSGKSFTQIASAKNVTAAQIVELASHAPKAALDSEVSDGLITRSDADKRLADFKAHITEEITETGVGRPDGDRGHGGHDGPPPTDSQPKSGTSR